jgi:CubicO group peptidase (beta-lactamase class C family)
MPTRAVRLLIPILLLCGATACAQSDAVDSYIELQVASRHIPGLSVAVVRDGKVVFAKGYGMANLELSVPARPDTVYELASVSKQFTATAVMLLVDEGKLKLDDPIIRHLPQAPKTWQAVTVRNLLNHTSGIKDYLGTKEISLRKDYSDDELVGMVAGLALDFPPGEKWSYSNTNYLLLGMLIEKASGQGLAEFLAARIFEPLGMESSRVNDTRAVIPRRATGYERCEGAYRIRDFVSPSLAATGDGEVVTTVLDLVRWDAALDKGTLLKRPTLEQMWTPARLKDGKTTHYGFGWAIGEHNGHRVIEHGGGFPGFNAHISRYRDDKLTVIVLANIVPAGVDRIARGVASKYVPALAGPEGAVVKDEDEETTSRLKGIVTALLQGKLDAGAFTEKSRRDGFPAKVQELGKRISPLGALKSFDLLKREEKDGLNVLRYRAVLGQTPLAMTFALTNDAKIAGLTIVVVKDEEENTTARLKRIVTDLLHGKLDAGVFTEESRKDGFPAKVQELGKRIAPLGALKSFDLLKREEKDGLNFHRYRAVLGQTPLAMTFALTNDGKIAGLTIVVAKDEDEETTSRLKGILTALLQGKLDAGAFTEESRKDGFPAKVQALGKRIAPLGPLKSFDLLKREEKDGLSVFRYRAVLGQTRMAMTFSMTADGKIAGLLIVPE